MNLSKREFVALELLKAKDITVEQAYSMADQLLVDTEVLINTEVVQSSTEVVQSSNHIKDQVAKGQVWLDLIRDKSLTIDTIDIIIRGKGSKGYRESAHFPTNMYRWAIMQEGESLANAKQRIIKERKLAASQPEMQKSVSDVFSSKIAHRFKVNNIHTLGDVLSLTPETVEGIYNIGAASIRGINEILSEKGLYLGMFSDGDYRYETLI